MSLILNTLTKEWLKFTVTGDVDLTDTDVFVGISQPGAEPTTFAAGEWTDTTTGRVLVGPGTETVFTVGVWDIWVKVSALPEIPVMNAGRIRVI